MKYKWNSFDKNADDLQHANDFTDRKIRQKSSKGKWREIDDIREQQRLKREFMNVWEYQ